MNIHICVYIYIGKEQLLWYIDTKNLILQDTYMSIFYIHLCVYMNMFLHIYSGEEYLLGVMRYEGTSDSYLCIYISI
jgi:hypothetical protein